MYRKKVTIIEQLTPDSNLSKVSYVFDTRTGECIETKYSPLTQKETAFYNLPGPSRHLVHHRWREKESELVGMGVEESSPPEL